MKLHIKKMLYLGILFGTMTLNTPNMHADEQREKDITTVLTILTMNYTLSQFTAMEIELLLETIDDEIKYIQNAVRKMPHGLQFLHDGLSNLQKQLEKLKKGDLSQVGAIIKNANSLKTYASAVNALQTKQTLDPKKQQAIQQLAQKISTSKTNVPVSPNSVKNQAQNYIG